ncbi:sulfotransferase [Devosia sp. 1566]|uniref:sulfotransferase n=1 Tax=Devosia sp. 1566 TaxID=2499144 RepID=UPI000FDA7A24|nr:sulfotransferase [Devosia sp. 1566]
MRTCILVLGMHRSGTSALTRILNLLGAQLPTNLLGAQLGNDAGHWEPRKLLALHDELLEAAGSRWDDLGPLDLSRLGLRRLDEFKTRVKTLLLEEYGNAPVFIVKDPRICRFVPFFIELLSEMDVSVRIALTLRNPLSVAASLVHRNGFSEGFASLLWLRHQLDAEAHSRSFKPFHVEFEQLLAEPAAHIGHLRSWMEEARITSSTPDAEIVASLRSDLAHFNYAPEDLARLPGPVSDAYLASRLLSDIGQRPQAQHRLSEIRAQFDPASALLGPVLAEEATARLKVAADEASRREIALGEEVETARRQVHELSIRAERAERELAQMRASTSWRLTAPVRQLKLGLVRTGQALKTGKGSSTAAEHQKPERCLVATTAHALFTAELIARNLRQAGFAVDMVRDRVGDPSPYRAVFVVCPQNFPDLPDGYYAVQMEQHVASRWFTSGYFRLLSRAELILDYSQQNIAYLEAQGVPAQQLAFMPLDTNPELLLDTAQQKDIDVLFYGNENCPRRIRILETLGRRFNVTIINDLFDDAMRDTIRRAKLVLNIHFYENGLLETNRLLEALSLGTPVISEVGADQAEHGTLAGIVDFVQLGDVDAMAQAIEPLLNDAAHYATREAAIRQFVAHKDNRFERAMSGILQAQGLMPVSSKSIKTKDTSTLFEGTVTG